MKILHLYHDILNLYGEYGNISALSRMLEQNGIAYDLEKKTLNDCLKLEEYDFIYMGSGTERNLLLVMEHLRSYKEALKNSIEQGKILLFTGNAFEMLGKIIYDGKGQEHQGLDLFDFTVTWQNRTRNTADAIFTMEGQEKPLVGFVNKCSNIEGITNPLFTVKMGLGNEKGGTTEGIREKNFFGTHLTGPILIKNPYFLEWIAALLCEKELNTDYLIYERKGYEVTLSELSKRITVNQ